MLPAPLFGVVGESDVALTSLPTAHAEVRLGCGATLSTRTWQWLRRVAFLMLAMAALLGLVESGLLTFLFHWCPWTTA